MPRVAGPTKLWVSIQFNSIQFNSIQEREREREREEREVYEISIANRKWNNYVPRYKHTDIFTHCRMARSL